MSIQDDGKKTISVTIEAAKLTGEILKAVLQDFFENKPETKGNQSLNKLSGDKADKLQNIQVTSNNIKDFKKIADKYNVDYNIKKDISDKDNPKYIVSFKGRDLEQVNKAFQEYAFDKTHDKKSRFSLSHMKELQTQIKSQIKSQTQERKEVQSL